MSVPICHVTEIGASANKGEVILSVRLHGEAGFDFVLDDATAKKLLGQLILTIVHAKHQKEAAR
jgi:hypothetical protein